MKFPTNHESASYKNLRLAAGLTARETAALLGVTRETISRREAGTMRITREAWIALAYVSEEAMQATWSYLAACRDLGRNDEAQTDEAQTDEIRNGQTLAEHAQAKAPKKRKVKRWK